MPKDFSYGIIPVFRGDDGLLSVLIVSQKNNNGEKRWGFPKGHPESSDTNIKETALREFKEETGLTPIISSNKEYIDNYLLERNGEHKDKTVTYFVGVVDTTEVNLDKNELADYRWVPSILADHFLTRDSTKAMYCQAEHEIETIGNHNKNSA